MVSIHLDIHGELRSLLRKHNFSGRYTAEVTKASSLFDVVQAQGFPHCEVGSLTLNGERAGWNDHVDEGDTLTVSPIPPGLLNPPLSAPPWPNPPIFLLDVHLGRLAGYLRLVGFDTLYHTVDPGDAALIEETTKEGRILLTCDRQLLMHRVLSWGYLIRSRQPKEQLAELLDRFELRRLCKPFTRCMKCNHTLRVSSVDEIDDGAPPLVRQRFGLNPAQYQSCSACGRLYWPGTHTDRLIELLSTWGISDSSVI